MQLDKVTVDAAEFKAGFDKVTADAAEYKAGFDKLTLDAVESKAQVRIPKPGMRLLLSHCIAALDNSFTSKCLMAAARLLTLLLQPLRHTTHSWTKPPLTRPSSRWALTT